jgi:predicted negative regulator of RcsB-dependent stress response
MAYDLQEQEQLAAIKAWWEKYGNFILAVATLVLLAIAAYNGWRWYERREAQQAAVVYEELLKALDGTDANRKKELAGTLIERYGRTVYAPMAALQMASIFHEAGDPSAARAQLQWVIDKSGHDEYALIARVRLAGVLLDDKAYDAALQVLSGSVPKAHLTAFADRRGDVLVAQGKTDQARAAYREALESADAQNPLRNLIQLKLDSLPAAS